MPDRVPVPSGFEAERCCYQQDRYEFKVDDISGLVILLGCCGSKIGRPPTSGGWLAPEWTPPSRDQALQLSVQHRFKGILVVDPGTAVVAG